MNYLIVTIYRPEYGDCSNGGASSPKNKKTLVVPCERGNLTEEDVANGGYVVLEPKEPYLKGHGYPIRLEPRGQVGRGMFGGNFAYSSDSRFGEEYGHTPLPIFDRVE